MFACFVCLPEKLSWVTGGREFSVYSSHKCWVLFIRQSCPYASPGQMSSNVPNQNGSQILLVELGDQCISWCVMTTRDWIPRCSLNLPIDRYFVYVPIGKMDILQVKPCIKFPCDMIEDQMLSFSIPALPMYPYCLRKIIRKAIVVSPTIGTYCIICPLFRW